jgi:hypothetical protein
MKLKYKYWSDGQIFRRDIYWGDGLLESAWYRYSPSETWRML